MLSPTPAGAALAVLAIVATAAIVIWQLKVYEQIPGMPSENENGGGGQQLQGGGGGFGAGGAASSSSSSTGTNGGGGWNGFTGGSNNNGGSGGSSTGMGGSSSLPTLPKASFELRVSSAAGSLDPSAPLQVSGLVRLQLVHTASNRTLPWTSLQPVVSLQQAAAPSAPLPLEMVGKMAGLQSLQPFDMEGENVTTTPAATAELFAALPAVGQLPSSTLLYSLRLNCSVSNETLAEWQQALNSSDSSAFRLNNNGSLSFTVPLLISGTLPSPSVASATMLRSSLNAVLASPGRLVNQTAALFQRIQQANRTAALNSTGSPIDSSATLDPAEPNPFRALNLSTELVEFFLGQMRDLESALGELNALPQEERDELLTQLQQQMAASGVDFAMLAEGVAESLSVNWLPPTVDSGNLTVSAGGGGAVTRRRLLNEEEEASTEAPARLSTQRWSDLRAYKQANYARWEKALVEFLIAEVALGVAYRLPSKPVLLIKVKFVAIGVAIGFLLGKTVPSLLDLLDSYTLQHISIRKLQVKELWREMRVPKINLPKLPTLRELLNLEEATSEEESIEGAFRRRLLQAPVTPSLSLSCSSSAAAFPELVAAVSTPLPTDGLLQSARRLCLNLVDKAPILKDVLPYACFNQLPVLTTANPADEGITWMVTANEAGARCCTAVMVGAVQKLQCLPRRLMSDAQKAGCTTGAAPRPATRSFTLIASLRDSTPLKSGGSAGQTFRLPHPITVSYMCEAEPDEPADGEERPPYVPAPPSASPPAAPPGSVGFCSRIRNCFNAGDALACTDSCYNSGHAPNCLLACFNGGDAPRCTNDCFNGGSAPLCTSSCFQRNGASTPPPPSDWHWLSDEWKALRIASDLSCTRVCYNEVAEMPLCTFLCRSALVSVIPLCTEECAAPNGHLPECLESCIGISAPKCRRYCTTRESAPMCEHDCFTGTGAVAPNSRQSCYTDGDAPLCRSYCFNRGVAPLCETHCHHVGDAPSCRYECQNAGATPQCSSLCRDSGVSNCERQCYGSGDAPNCRRGCMNLGAAQDCTQMFPMDSEGQACAAERAAAFANNNIGITRLKADWPLQQYCEVGTQEQMCNVVGSAN